MAHTPRLYRVVVQVSDVDAAAAFYGALLGTPGRRIPGQRHYFDCGDVIFAVLDPSPGESASPTPDFLYFAVDDLEAIHRRAETLGCLSTGSVHGASAGQMVTRPWGE
ncbi:MAG TPA: VOC family protein, partial [Candidatus Limnocylindria bacterium]|nr:VOC family protein [Candidatus Limnocylindria bacterium]